MVDISTGNIPTIKKSPVNISPVRWWPCYRPNKLNYVLCCACKKLQGSFSMKDEWLFVKKNLIVIMSIHNNIMWFILVCKIITVWKIKISPRDNIFFCNSSLVNKLFLRKKMNPCGKKRNSHGQKKRFSCKKINPCVKKWILV